MIKRKKFFYVFLTALLVMSVFSACQKDNPIEENKPQIEYSSLKVCLDDAQNVTSVQPIELTENSYGYKEMYEVRFTQPVNHFGSSATFSQKAYVFYVGAIYHRQKPILPTDEERHLPPLPKASFPLRPVLLFQQARASG